MHILFVVATSEEWNAAKPSYLAPIASNGAEQEIHFFTDEHERRNGVLVTGVGALNAAFAMGKVLSIAQKARTIINIGLAGSFNLENAALCSHWRVVREVYPEFCLAAGDEVDVKNFRYAQWQTPEKEVWDEVVLPELLQWNTRLRYCPLQGEATSVSVAGVTCCQARATRLYKVYGGSLLENMEGFSIAMACSRYNLPLLEIRTVSNLVGTRDPEYRAFSEALAAMRPLVAQLLA